MLGNFTYCNPTKLYFGKNSEVNLKAALEPYKKIMLVYGGGSIKKTGLYDKIMKILSDENKIVYEDPGVMPNPTLEKLYEGCKIARENEVYFSLAVCGGSVCDYSKSVSASGHQT
ncbi:MAG: iron-containing alcohol dehydrogenase, partial [Clostridia bacterium]|nr:iron-containing alcohol dehydrogenase [Clostridia bacterium]